MNLNTHQANSLAKDITYIFKYYFQNRYIQTSIDAGTDIQRRYYQCKQHWDKGTTSSARGWIEQLDFLQWFTYHVKQGVLFETEKP